MRCGRLVRLSSLVASAALLSCSKPARDTAPPARRERPGVPLPAAAPSPGQTEVSCASGPPMTLHFYDVGQALSVLIDLPDGRHVLVDAGDSARREGCGQACARAQAHLLDQLRSDLRGAPLDLLWITHPHADHVGGAPQVIASVPVRLYVDNGRDGRKAEVRRAREAAATRGAAVSVVDPDHVASPLPSTANVRLTPVVPPAWPRGCREDENECSIALRLDYCASSVLLTGDAEHEEEGRLDPGGPVTLLQVGHHGSDTSSSPAFLGRTRPRYAVISAGKPDEGLNRDYCHPRAIVVERLSRVLGGGVGGDGATTPLAAFDGTRCDRATASDWVQVPASDRLWATERDGDVVLTTRGDGAFRRIASAPR